MGIKKHPKPDFYRYMYVEVSQLDIPTNDISKIQMYHFFHWPSTDFDLLTCLISVHALISELSIVYSVIRILTSDFHSIQWVYFHYPHAFLKKRRGYCNLRPSVPPSVCPLCYLLLNRWTKFNQILCVSYSHEWGVQQQFFVAPPPGALGRGQKVKYHLISITKSISKIFIPNFVFVLTNERNKTYQTGF